MHSAIATPSSDLSRDRLRDAPAGRPRIPLVPSASRLAALALPPAATAVSELRPLTRPFAVATSDTRPSPRDPHQRMLEAMRIIRDLVQPSAKVVRAGDMIFRAAQPFNTVYLINAGAFKLVSRSLDGREQIVSLKFRGDWLGFSGIAQGRHPCDAVAMDTGNISIIPYDTLTEACARHPVREFEQGNVEEETVALAQFMRERTETRQRQQDADEYQQEQQAVPTQEGGAEARLRPEDLSGFSRHARARGSGAQRSPRRPRRTPAQFFRRAGSLPWRHR